MNSAPVFAADLSERKAYTSALVGLRTADLVSARAARTVAVRPDGRIRRTVLFDGRRRAAYRRRPTDRRRRRKRRHRRTGRRDTRIGAPRGRSADTTDMKLEVVVTPGLRRRIAPNASMATSVGAGHRLRIGRRLSGNPVHAARLGLLDHLRQERHDGCTRLGEGLAPDRVRHRGHPSRHCSAAGSQSVSCSMTPAAFSIMPLQKTCSVVQIRSGKATHHTLRSAIRTATAGCSRKSPRG